MEYELFQRVSHVNYPNGGMVWMGKGEVYDYDDPPTSNVMPYGVFNEETDYDKRKQKTIRMPTSELSCYTLPMTRNPRNMAAYIAMCRAAIEKGWPEHYNGDLIHHDALTLGVHPLKVQVNEIPDGTPFGWILRDCGTELCRVGDEGYNPARYWKEEKYLYYWWTGNDLLQASGAEKIIELCRFASLS